MNLSLRPFMPASVTRRRYLNRLRALLPRTRPVAGPVFGIGLSRTGTKSLHRAFELLGYRSDHFSTHLLHVRGTQLGFILRDAALYDALTDITASTFFQELDQSFPDAKFVLTVRNREAWLRSCERHFAPFGKSEWPYGIERILLLRQRVYGCTTFDRALFDVAYERHVAAVRAHFADRPGKLLELDVCREASWSPLCGLLNLPEPTVPFPWANKYKERAHAS